MFGGGDMKGWQAVPIIIPLFLIISIATIWYFSFHHFTDRPRYQNFSSPMNSSSRHSRTSEVFIAGPQNSNHLVHLIDIPPLPASAFSNARQQGNPVSEMGDQLLSVRLRLTRSRRYMLLGAQNAVRKVYNLSSTMEELAEQVTRAHATRLSPQMVGVRKILFVHSLM